MQKYQAIPTIIILDDNNGLTGINVHFYIGSDQCQIAHKVLGGFPYTVINYRYLDLY